RTNYIVLGFTLFALFFGAGNLIFPAELGQYSGTKLFIAAFGFAITGVGLPLLGIMAIGFSNSNNLQALVSRLQPIYGVFFYVFWSFVIQTVIIFKHYQVVYTQFLVFYLPSCCI